MQRPKKSLIEVAAKRKKADLVIKNANIYNTFTGSFIKGDLAVTEGYIAAIGEEYEGKENFEAKGHYLIPGFIDCHVHIESSMASPLEFAKILLLNGTTTVIADPHEIANACGLAGIEYILNSTENIPFNAYVMLPSCVPASPLEEGAAILLAKDLKKYLKHPRVLGLGEMMNYPGVIANDKEVLNKLHLCDLIDGHAPNLSGSELMAYAAGGISTDHESISVKEATERLKVGLKVLIREGSATKNLIDLLPLINNDTAHFCMFATDDRHSKDLLEEGSINYLVRLALENSNLALSTVLKIATYNGYQHYGLKNLGLLAPGYIADFGLYPNLKEWKPSELWKNGNLVVKNSQVLEFDNKFDSKLHSKLVRNTVKFKKLEAEQIKVKKVKKDSKYLRVIGIIEKQVVTENREEKLALVNNEYQIDVERDILKIVVADRYHEDKTSVGVGFIKGLGLKKGAIASTVAHDSHNLIICGTNDKDILKAAEIIKKNGGGLTIVVDEKEIDSLALPIGGLLSDLSLEEINDKLSNMHKHVLNLGLKDGNDPFMTLAFMSLPVIPHLKITKNGLVDVDKFEIVDIEV